MRCPFCENPLAPGSKFCPHCGSSLVEPPPAGPGSPHPPPYGPPPFAPNVPPTSNLAITSLVAGLVAWFVVPIVGAIVAVITGHMARAEIRSRSGQLAGDGLALVGLILGYLQLALAALILIVIVAFFGWVTTMVVQSRPQVVPAPTTTQVVPPGTVPGVAGPSPVDQPAVDNVAERVLKIVSDHFMAAPDQVTPATSLADDLNADELDLIELVMEFEEEFDITIPDEEIDAIKTVGQAIELIKAKQEPVRGERERRDDPPAESPHGEDPHGQRRDPRTSNHRAWASAGLGPVRASAPA